MGQVCETCQETVTKVLTKDSFKFAEISLPYGIKSMCGDCYCEWIEECHFRYADEVG